VVSIVLGGIPQNGGGESWKLQVAALLENEVQQTELNHFDRQVESEELHLISLSEEDENTSRAFEADVHTEHAAQKRSIHCDTATCDIRRQLEGRLLGVLSRRWDSTNLRELESIDGIVDASNNVCVSCVEFGLIQHNCQTHYQ
jgi:hypothetical protein